MRASRLLTLGALAACLAGCARYDYTGSLNITPAVGTLTTPGELLAHMPPPVSPIRVAVYDYPDLTGQNKTSPSPNYAEYSRAITQGSSAILVDALKTSGRGTWFNVVERSYLDSLLRERKLIQDTYTFLKKDPLKLIDPLTFADYLVTGGVVSYDSPIASAGAGGGFRGIEGGFTTSKDLVTVNIRLVRVRDGVVLKSINASRPIVSIGAQADAARIVGRSIVTAQASASLVEATQTAVRESIEMAVYELARQGTRDGLWTLPDPPAPAAATAAPRPVPPPASAAARR